MHNTYISLQLSFYLTINTSIKSLLMQELIVYWRDRLLSLVSVSTFNSVRFQHNQQLLTCYVRTFIHTQLPI